MGRWQAACLLWSSQPPRPSSIRETGAVKLLSWGETNSRIHCRMLAVVTLGVEPWGVTASGVSKLGDSWVRKKLTRANQQTVLTEHPRTGKAGQGS